MNIDWLALATAEQLEMARRICADHYRLRARNPKNSYGHEMAHAERLISGDSDDWDCVHTTLAAIIETTEAAAKLADAAAAGNRRREAQYRESAENDPSTAGQQVDMETAVAFAKMASGSSALAASLRSNVHLKAQS